MNVLPPRLHPLLFPLTVLLVFIVYGRSLNGGFVFDDHHFVENNQSIRTLKNAARFFSDPSTQSSHEGLNTGIYRPLATLSFAADYAIAGLNPAYSRAVNLLLHCCNTLLVVYLGMLLGFSGLYAALMGAFFALFPTNVESFVWISGRSAALSTALILCAVICFIKNAKSGRTKYLRLASLFTIAALFTRETAVVIPLLALAYLAAGRLPVKKHLFAVGTYLALPAGSFLLLRSLLLGRLQQAPPPDLPLSTLVSVPFLLFAKYVDIMLYPFSMLVTYTDSINARISAFWFYFPFAIAVFLLYSGLTAVLRARGERIAAWGLLWVLISLLPVLNIVSMTIYAAERLAYLPLVGLAMVVAAAARGLAGKGVPRKTVLAAFCVLFILFTVNIQARMRVWRDDVSLWRYDAEKNPRNFLTRLRLAEALRAAGELPEAHAALIRALDLASNDGQRAIACNELGTSYAVSGDLEKAERFFRASVELNPGGYLGLYNLGKVCAMRRDIAAARKYLGRSLELNGEYVPARELEASLRNGTFRGKPAGGPPVK